MVFVNLVDTHTHTINSFDGNHTPEHMYNGAVAKNVKYLAFTDHLEMDVFFDKNFDKTAEKSFADTLETKENMGGRLNLLTGAELGECVYEKELSEKLMKQYDYDMVIGAIHNLPGRDDFYDIKLDEDTDFYPLLDEYFDWELKMAQWAKFDTLAHLTYPLRYIKGNYHRDVDMGRYKDLIDEILLSLIRNKTALELNTAGYRQPIGIPSPDGSIIRRYKELGGEMLTIGSDAHYAEHIAGDYDRAYALALECGFDKFTVFVKREPVFITIE